MLAADKLQLQSSLKQQATALKEKEFNLHHNNFMTVGTQAAVLAGLDVTMFIEFQPPANEEWSIILIPRVLKFAYYVCITAAFCSNILVVAQTTILSVLGASLALRGPDGSMMSATDGLYHERAIVFRNFGYGLVLTVGSVVLCVWLHHFSWEASLACCLISLWTIHSMRGTYYRIVKKFDFDESMTVDLSDFFNGPAAISSMPIGRMFAEGARGFGINTANMNGRGKVSFDAEEGLRDEDEACVRRNGNTNMDQRFITV